jgi:hypothetical protein
MGHAIVERVRLFGTRSADYIKASSHSGCIATEVTLQAKTGRIHDRTRTLRRKVRFPLAPRAPSIHDPMYGPAVRCKRTSSGWWRAVLHQCIRPLIGVHAPGHHGYQRTCDLISGQASRRPFGSPVFGHAGKKPRQVLLPCAMLPGSIRLRFAPRQRERLPGMRGRIQACEDAFQRLVIGAVRTNGLDS